MPFRGIVDGEVVAPVSVADQQPVECPECGGTMYPREGKSQARHFYHVAENAEERCSAARGESETHSRCVALAAEALEEEFGDQAVRSGIEIYLDVSSSPTEPSHRRADALLEFESTHEYYGRGIVIEVQYKNYAKDTRSTTHDYLLKQYSVAWLTPSDFKEDKLDYSVVERVFKTDGRDAYSVEDHDYWEFESRVEAGMRWDVPKHDDGRGETHDWYSIPAYVHPDGYSYQVCSCGSRRKYDHEQGRFVYDHDSVLAPSRPEVDILLPTENDSLVRRTVEWEKELFSNEAVAPCRGPKRVHEWGNQKKHEYTTSWSCDHCPVRLVKGVLGGFALVGHPEREVRYLIETNASGPKELDHYCSRCDEFVEPNEYYWCGQCSSNTLFYSIFDVVPPNWNPAGGGPDAPAYRHEFLDVTVTLYPPIDQRNKSLKKEISPSMEDPRPNGYSVQVKWPNHIAYHHGWIAPEAPVRGKEEGEAWYANLLVTVDEKYDPEDLTSIGMAFGGDVAAATRESPIVDQGLYCVICDAYLPHYYGSEPSTWYEYHYDYIEDDKHPMPGGDDGPAVYGEFYAGCPHCDQSTNNPHGFIDHLEEHGYPRREAHNIMQRLG